MGGCGSKGGGGAQVYASTEDPLVTDVKEKIAALDDAGKGCPTAKLNELLDAIGAETLRQPQLGEAVRTIDPATTGYMSSDAFLDWFHHAAPPEEEAYVPEVHESVRKGLKDEGEAEGTGGYDDDLLDPAAAAKREAELERQLDEQIARDKAKQS